jgi:hypothetical protein
MAQETVHIEESASHKNSLATESSRGSVKTTEIAMGGVKVKVRTDATPAWLKQVRELVESRYDEFSDTLAKGVSAHQLSVLVAFNLAEELLKEREKVKLLKRRTVDCSDRLIDRVESYLNRDNR